MTEDQKTKTRAWLVRLPTLEDLYEVAGLVWQERLRRLRIEDQRIIPQPSQEQLRIQNLGKNKT